MLSAVAARKAARAAKAAASPAFNIPLSEPPSPPPQSRSSSPSLPLDPSTPPPSDQATSKRKPRLSANPRLSKNKKVKFTHALANPGRDARYFHPTGLSDARTGHESSIGPSQDLTRGIEFSSESDSSSEEMEIEVDVPPPAGSLSVPVTNTKRAWSPSRPMRDSSDDDESDSFDPASILTPLASVKPEPAPLSTLRPVPNHNVFPVPKNDCANSGKACILVFQPHETLALAGTYSLCVLQGSLSLLGVTLSPSDTKHLVFAPRASPVPILSWAKSDRQGSCTLSIPPAIRQQADTTAVLIECTGTGVEGLGQICRVFENTFSAPRESDAIPGIDPQRIHIINHGTKDIHPFVLPGSWEAALDSIDQQQDSEPSIPPVCLVKGSKKSGKSTLARVLVNRLLNRYRRVAFLECDLGQSEFTPGGLVALNLVESYLFGPPFTHPSLPYRAHYIGSTTPRASPSHYLHSTQSLLETYKLDLQFPASHDHSPPGDERIYDTIPLVVNTMGWHKGLGADLNVRIEEFVDASHTFEIDGAKEKRWPTQQLQHVPQSSTHLSYINANADNYIKVEAIQADMSTTYHTATDDRHLNILSYFHAVFPEPPGSSPFGPVLKQLTATSWNTSLPLCALYPYEVDYTKAIDHVYLTGPGYEDVVPSELTRVLNGAIVGLVSHGLAQPLQLMSQEIPPLPYTPGEPPPDPAFSMCHGLALIRGVPLQLGPQSPHMHVLTPVPTCLLSQARVLVKGEMELPIWGMLDFREEGEGMVAGADKAHVPFLQWGKREGIGGERRRVRRNLMRKGQM